MQPTTTNPKLTLRGGVPYNDKFVALWREGRLTDFSACAEGVEFKVHRVVLASSSEYFLKLFESGLGDASGVIHSLEDMPSKALEALLAFVYEGKCEIDEDQLTDVLEASARLTVDPLKDACVDVIEARLAPSNAFDVWRLADTFTLLELMKAAVEVALLHFEELPAGGPSGHERGGRLLVGRAVVGDRQAARDRATCRDDARALRGDGGGVPVRDRCSVVRAGLCGSTEHPR